MWTRWLSVSTAVVIMLLMVPSASAQTARGTILGTVSDATGAVIPGVNLTITNEGTRQSRTTVADERGQYEVAPLPVGTYSVTAELTGFKKEIHAGIVLQVDQKARIDLTLQVGGVTEVIEVSGEAPAVQLTSSSIGAVVNSDTVVDLPLNGRDWTQLATLEPGVNLITTQQPAGGAQTRASRGNGAQLTISGTRPQTNNYRLDGISIVDSTGGGPGSVMGIALGVDAIAEFSVLTANHSAEYGRTAGGVVNAVSRSGTNQIHGSAYWFLRSDKFDARNFFDKNIAPFHRNQFGASAGGPIHKDKTFFFADFEGIREALGVTAVNNVPSPDARNGILHNADGTTTTLRVDPLVVPFLAFYPLPNAGLTGTGNTGRFVTAVNNINRENFWTAKIDHKISDKDSVFMSTFRDTAKRALPDSYNLVLNASTSVNQMIAVEETHVFSPSLVNSLRGGFSRVVAVDTGGLGAINPIVLDTSLGTFPGHPAAEIIVPGLTRVNGSLKALGPDGKFVSASGNRWNSFQAYDDASKIKGAHSLKFGFAFERMQLNARGSNFGDNGRFTFGSLTDFLTNRPSRLVTSAPTASPGRGIRQSLFGGYLQDDWRWRPNLTLNLGLRYEAVTVPVEVHGKLANLRTFTAATPHLGSPYFNNPTLRNFEPRVGFAWDPFDNGKTAVRAAFGIFDVLPLYYPFSKIPTAPFSQNITVGELAPGSFPREIATALLSATISPSQLQSAAIEFNPPRNYMMIWNLNIQRELTPATTLKVGYVGNHGVHMLDRSDDLNMVLPTLTAQGYLWPSPAGSGTRLNPNVGTIRGIYWSGDSQYAALEAQVTKRMSHGFQGQASYTWGKNIDTGSASVIGDPFVNSVNTLLEFCKRCRRGVSDYNIAQTLKVNYLWIVPTPKNWGNVASRVLGGWQLGGIFTTQTGLPMTPLIDGDPLGLRAQDPKAYPNRLSGPECDSLVNPGDPNNYIKLYCFAPPNPLTLLGNAGRNTVVGPGLVNFDFSLFKNNRISESFNAQLRAEFFNIFNRANFAPPIANSALFDQRGSPIGGAGALDQTSTTSRQLQFALKLVW